MELEFSEQEVAFQLEVRAFIRANLPEGIRSKIEAGERLTRPELATWTRILNDRGWGAPHWPRAHGGCDWTPVQQYIFKDELASAYAPEPLGFGINLVGPVLHTFGTEAQKKHYLPRILRLDDWWAQGFSEPGSGSDLASVCTSALRDGDAYFVNGQKIWTTLAQHADWIFCLVRTDTRAKSQEGISFLLIDMKSPGVTVKPIITIEGGHEVNEVFFDNVRVPAANLVGEENKGWSYAKFLLGNERVSAARIGVARQQIIRIKKLAAQEQVNGVPIIETTRFREKLALVEVELKALEITQLRVLAAASKRTDAKPDPATSVLKLKGSEIQLATADLLMEVLGPGVLRHWPESSSDEAMGAPPYSTKVTATYFNWRKVSIYGGTSEVQRNIIAKAILGL